MAAAATAFIPPPDDKSKPWFPQFGDVNITKHKNDGWSNEDSATATCLCGAVQLSMPGLVNSFICHCADCHKLTVSMFASNFTVRDTHLKHLRGKDNLKTYAITLASGNTTTNYFCSTCGSLLYRVASAFPGMSIMRIGSVDDFHLHETKLKPTIEAFTRSRVGWLHGVEGLEKFEGMF